jgi:DNA-binding HxlR family transcriptional regulator
MTMNEQAQHRPASRYDAFVAACPTRSLLAVLTDKWVCLILCALAEAGLRHGELARRVGGVTQKMLTQTLRSLERDGIVSRTVTPSVPPQVEYSLTELGASLSAPLSALKDWAEMNMDEVLVARQHHDGAAR